VPARVEALLEERKQAREGTDRSAQEARLGGGAGAGEPSENETVAGVGFLGKAVSGVEIAEGSEAAGR
jgi:alanyl-tRNA synthetase